MKKIVFIIQPNSALACGFLIDNPMNPNNVHVAYHQLTEFTSESIQELYCNLDDKPIHIKERIFRILPKNLRIVF